MAARCSLWTGPGTFSPVLYSSSALRCVLGPEEAPLRFAHRPLATRQGDSARGRGAEGRHLPPCGRSRRRPGSSTRGRAGGQLPPVELAPSTEPAGRGGGARGRATRAVSPPGPPRGEPLHLHRLKTSSVMRCRWHIRGRAPCPGERKQVASPSFLPPPELSARPGAEQLPILPPLSEPPTQGCEMQALSCSS